jgi:hypothetical protein
VAEHGRGAEVIWAEDADRLLAAAVARTWEADPLAWAARIVGSASGLAPELRSALVKACLAPHAPRTVEGLSRAGEMEPSRLRYLWNQNGPAGRATPRELVEWLLVGWAFRRWREGVPWPGVAQRMRTTVKRLRAVFRRRTGLCPTDACWRGPTFLLRLIAEWWSQTGWM